MPTPRTRRPPVSPVQASEPSEPWEKPLSPRRRAYINQEVKRRVEALARRMNPG